MSYEIRKEQRDEVHTLVMSRRVSPSALAEAMAELLPEVYEHAMKSGLSITGVPFVIYTDWSAGGVTLTGGLPVADPGEGTDEIRPYVFPAGEYVVTVHPGSYDTLDKAHEALEQWMAEHGLQAGEANYEFYLTDPGQYPDEADWRTEVLRQVM